MDETFDIAIAASQGQQLYASWIGCSGVAGHDSRQEAWVQQTHLDYHFVTCHAE